MATIKIPYIGTIDSSSVEEYYYAVMSLNNIEVQIDLNFEAITIDVKRLEIVKHFIENIRIHDLNNKKYLHQDFNKHDEPTSTYIGHHLEELGTDDLHDLVGSSSKTSDHPKLLLNKLYLMRVGLYPESETEFAVFDYSVGKELTNYVVAINTDDNGNISSLAMES
ncbi:MAG: DUF2004 domain-containing protein [Ferruginibacter sp.]